MDPAQLRMKLDPVENGLTNCQVWSQPNKGYSGYQNAVQSKFLNVFNFGM